MADRLLAVAQGFNTTCDLPLNQESAQENPLARLWRAHGSCSHRNRAPLPALEAKFVANAPDHEGYASLLAEAQDALEHERGVVARFRWDGTKLHAETLAGLMEMHEWHKASLMTVDMLWKDYLARNSTSSLHNALLNLLVVRGDGMVAELFEPILTGSSSCELVSFQESPYVTQGRALAAESPDLLLSTPIGRLQKSSIPSYDLFVSLGWWPGALAKQSEMEWIVRSQNGEGAGAPYHPTAWMDWMTQTVRASPYEEDAPLKATMGAVQDPFAGLGKTCV
jgi:hypothetical protein